MAIAAAPGYPQQSGIMIPEVWSGKLLAKFYAATALAAIANTDYEGEIKSMGDKVWIRTTPDIAIKKYSKGQNLDIQRPEPSKLSLSIDQANYWSTNIDDIDKFQSDINFFEDWTRDASEQMKIALDTEVFGQCYADADAANAGTTAGKISKAINLGATGSPLTVGNGSGDVGPVDFIVRIGQALDEQNVPQTDRWVMIPSWLAAKLKLSDLKNAYLTGDAKSPIRNGLIGDIDRNKLYISNLLAQTVDGGNTCTHVIGGQKSAMTFASQLTENETIKAESTFGWIARGLQVYGWKTVKPEALVHAYIKPGT